MGKSWRPRCHPLRYYCLPAPIPSLVFYKGQQRVRCQNHHANGIVMSLVSLLMLLGPWFLINWNNSHGLITKDSSGHQQTQLPIPRCSFPRSPHTYVPQLANYNWRFSEQDHRLFSASVLRATQSDTQILIGHHGTGSAEGLMLMARGPPLD